jgi:Protein of unknown function (DUF2927)
VTPRRCVALHALRFLAALGLAFVAGPVSAQESRPSDADVLKAFKEISASTNPAQRDQDKTLQWRRDIHFAILTKGPALASWISLIGRTLTDVEPIVPVKIAYATDSADFAFIFVDDNDAGVNSYRSLLTQIVRTDEGLKQFRDSLVNRQQLCNNVTLNTQSVITFHLIWVYTKAPKPETSVENCLVRSIAKGLGVGRHESTANSIFNTKLDLHELSAIDKAMLKTFFAAAIPPGTPVEDAQAMFEHRLKSEGAN